MAVDMCAVTASHSPSQRHGLALIVPADKMTATFHAAGERHASPSCCPENYAVNEIRRTDLSPLRQQCPRAQVGARIVNEGLIPEPNPKQGAFAEQGSLGHHWHWLARYRTRTSRQTTSTLKAC